MKIKSYLATLVIACLMVGYGVELIISSHYTAVDTAANNFLKAKLWQKHLERIHHDTSQYLFSAELIIASSETYLALSTLNKGQLLAVSFNNMTAEYPEMATAAGIEDLAAAIETIHAMLQQSLRTTGAERPAVMKALTAEFDLEATQLSQTLEASHQQADAQVAVLDAKAQKLRAESKTLSTVTRTIFAVALFALWFWANRRISAPLRQLRKMADATQTGAEFTGIKNGPEEIKLLSENFTNLTNSLSHQATHDALTKLMNRRAFEDMLIKSVEDTNLTGRAHVLCFIDLDYFKTVNDTCGHMAGDDLLTRVARVFEFNTRDSDCVARLGGDEFAILLTGCEITDGMRSCEKILEAVRNLRFTWEGQVFHISASIGVTQIRKDGKSSKDILNLADLACKHAKESGRDSVHLLDSSDNLLIKKRAEIARVNQLKTAIDEDRLVLFKQDIVSLASKPGPEKYYEVLVRMKGADGTLICPGEFMPLAERYHLSTKLDRWIVNAVIDWLSEHPEELENLGSCSINLSGQSMGSKDLREFIVEKLKANRAAASKLCFEITETAAITDIANAKKLIEELKEFGCTFALDDFGSGLSSFTYLAELPVDVIKIDGSFVKDCAKNPGNYAIVKAINDVAKSSGKTTVAEFVETEDIIAQLELIGVDFAQGYHFSTPHQFISFEKNQPRKRLGIFAKG